jgi:hypothetical protein
MFKFMMNIEPCCTKEFIYVFSFYKGNSRHIPR